MSEDKFRRACNAVTRHFMPNILFTLLAEQQIDRDRISDHAYVWSVVLENLDMLDDLETVSVIDEEFVKAAKEAADTERVFVALVLIATAIEHKINHFYREILERKYALERDEVTHAIRSNAESKIGWLFSLVSGGELSGDLKKRIQQVQQWRNSLVHYKAVPYHVNDVRYADRISGEIREAGIEKILKLPIELEEELNRVRLETIPLLEEAHRLADAILQELPEDELGTES